MRTFDRSPEDWRDLEKMVGQLFSEMNFSVKVGETHPTVRGSKEIDVWAFDHTSTPQQLYVCECKYWKQKVSQEIVHSFRTVVHDLGAHRGFIISTQGFQRGAYEAREHSNVDLLTFEKLQAIFFDRWRIAMGERYLPYGDQLFPYWDYPGRMPQFKWAKRHIERQQELIKAYEPLVHLGPLEQKRGFEMDLPIVVPSVNERGEIGDLIELATYRAVFEFIKKNKDIALYHFQVLFGEIRPSKIEGE